MLRSLYPIFISAVAVVLLAPEVNALAYQFPKETNAVGDIVYPRSRAHDARSPAPTGAPDAARALAMLEKRALDNVCGWWNGYELSCDANLYCAYNTRSLLAGCCPVDSAGSFTSCFIASTCLGSSAKVASCGTDDCSEGTVWCESATAPNCVTYSLSGEIDGVTGNYMTFRCGATAGLTRSADITSPTTTSSATSSSITDTATDANVISNPTGTATVTVTPTSNSSGSNGGGSSKKSNTGAIAGGVVGGVVGLALLAGAAFFIIKRMNAKKAERQAEDVPEMTGTVNPK